MSVTSNQEAAVRLAEMGFRVFPCINDPSAESHKKPLVEGWPDTPIRPAWQIAALWASHPDALPAIPVGAHDLVVIDCDRKNGVDGVAEFTALCANLGIDLSSAFVVQTPSSGLHFYWRSDVSYSGQIGKLAKGIDIRSHKNFVVAPGSTLSDGRSYRHVAGSWESIPALPDALAALLKRKNTSEALALSMPTTTRPAPTERERSYGENALADECAKLAATREGEGRNAALNNAGHSLGTMVGAAWIEREVVTQALWEAAEQNGYRAKDGNHAAWATLQSGLEAGISKPRPPLPPLEIPQWLRESVATWITAYKAKHSAQSIAKSSVTLLPFSQIEEKPVTWLWDQYLPLGKLTLLAGAGGTGKSTIAFSFAGTISNGGFWPDGTRCDAPGNVLIWSSEDDARDTIKPRLLAVNADVRRCMVIRGAKDANGVPIPFDPASDMDALREAVSHIGGVSLLIIDPIVSAVTGDMNKANDVRRSLQAFVDFATEMNASVLGITHFAKGTAGKNSAERVIGSTAFKDFSRMTLVAAKDEESNRRVFTRAKSNYSPDTGGFNYSIEVLALRGEITATHIVWGEPLEGSSRAILASIEGDGHEDGEKMRGAKQFLIEMLSNGPAPSKELLKQAREAHGITEDTLRRAYKQIGTKPIRVGFGTNGTWMWALPIGNPSACR